jgi:hypothetical protein
MNNRTLVQTLEGLTISSLRTLKLHFGIMRTALYACESTLDKAISTNSRTIVDIGQLEAAYGNLMPVFRNVQTNQVRLDTARNAENNAPSNSIDKARIDSLENAVNLVLALARDGKLTLDAKAKEQLTLSVL